MLILCVRFTEPEGTHKYLVKIILGVYLMVFLGEINILVGRLSRAD